MTQSLLTGASGLLAHQQKLDVVANNIANVNTTSFKTQRALFSDTLYSTIQEASGSTGPEFGGINPQQIGFGVNLSQVSSNFSQGVLTDTGESFDFALQGDGFFVVEGQTQQFTRDGSFSVNSDGFLVDPSTGGFVQRVGTIGEGSDELPQFQAPGDTEIIIPLGASVPGRETEVSEFIGNLPASAIPPLAEIVTTASPLLTSGNPVTPTTLLNDLDNNATGYTTGDTIDIVGSQIDGSTYSISIPVDATTTVGDLVNVVNAELTGATLAVTPEGNLELSADETGDALLSLNFDDAPTNVGTTDFVDNLFVLQTDGKAGDTFESTIQIFDLRGQPHGIQATFEKLDDNRWEARFSSGESGVTLTDNLVADIIFNEDGSFQTVNGLDDGDANIELEIDSLGQTQTISIGFDRFTHLATDFTSTFDQDGFPPGNIVSVSVSSEGIIDGVATNGRRLPIAQLAVAVFANNQGLENLSQNFYIATPNSGVPQIGPAEFGGAGEVRSGQLETSNVDLALEFTQLIVAQRGFSANSRTITVATEILEELTNIVR